MRVGRGWRSDHVASLKHCAATIGPCVERRLTLPLAPRDPDANARLPAPTSSSPPPPIGSTPPTAAAQRTAHHKADHLAKRRADRYADRRAQRHRRTGRRDACSGQGGDSANPSIDGHESLTNVVRLCNHISCQLYISLANQSYPASYSGRAIASRKNFRQSGLNLTAVTIGKRSRERARDHYAATLLLARMR